MKITLATLSDYATIDAQGKLSVMGLVDVLGAPQFPVTHPQLFVCFRVQCRPIEVGTKHAFTVVLQDPDGGQVLPPIRGGFEVKPSSFPGAPHSHMQLALGAVGIVFKRPGTHSFEIALDDNHAVSIPLHVVQVAAPAKPKAR